MRESLSDDCLRAPNEDLKKSLGEILREEEGKESQI